MNRCLDERHPRVVGALQRHGGLPAVEQASMRIFSGVQPTGAKRLGIHRRMRERHALAASS
jgi:hypothetical protein